MASSKSTMGCISGKQDLTTAIDHSPLSKIDTIFIRTALPTPPEAIKSRPVDC